MCGIAGWIDIKNPIDYTQNLEKALQKLHLRGPDNRAILHQNIVHLGHARLSIIDVSDVAHQPMFNHEKNLCIVFNGEIFNFLELKQELLQEGYLFNNQSDTEVILQLYQKEGEKSFQRLNGFFAFVLYDITKNKIFIVRDRYGIKPLYIHQNENSFFFASELKALMEFPIPPKIQSASVGLFFNLNYLPPNISIYENVQPFPYAHYAVIQNQSIEFHKYYELKPPKIISLDYEQAQKDLLNLLEDAVQKRLIADVPLGVFLSGGIDSSVIATLAARHQKHLKTFSIGFENPLYDETHYAKLVAQKAQTEHTVFTLKMEELYENLFDVLDYLDEPFADASAINFYILSKYTKKHVTVALSGDGADELFGGYTKHVGEYQARQNHIPNQLLKVLQPLLSIIPSNRNSKLGRKIWQVQKYTKGLKDSYSERYWKWCSVLEEEKLPQLLALDYNKAHFEKIKAFYTQNIQENSISMNDVFLTDLQLVLPGDMLVKGDRMSMANSLEVRVPFLDYRVVDFVNQLPSEYKVYGNMRKRILQDASKKILPPELYNRPKQGFEVPLKDWFCGPMKTYLEKEILNRDFVQEQGIFHYAKLQELCQTVWEGKNTKEDWTLWSVVVFQHWYKKYFQS
ncbi:MAG: asparagine synthetase B [Bacteroidia bacterium]|nr:MAG: asparagine synthetase B [Bacteroidia bacterium]